MIPDTVFLGSFITSKHRIWFPFGEILPLAIEKPHLTLVRWGLSH